MRPIRLVLTAFGPYAQTQAIDFRELKESSFLLIHGPTGSGKTSVLDGVTFALYGDTSTRERQAKQMRSHHALPELETSVEFDFSLGTESYRVCRTPEQLRPRKRGNGEVKQPGNATLWSRTGLVNDADEGKVLVSGYTDVSAKVEELLGFRSDQFRQVVILPQGQFRDFLIAGSDKREEILEILFKTHIYRLIQESLKEKAREIKDQWNMVMERRAALFHDSGASSLQDLDTLYTKADESARVVAREIDEARENNRVAGEILKKGERDLEKIREKEAAESVFQDLVAQKISFDEKEEFLAKARKTLPLQPLEEETRKRKKEAYEADRRYREQEDLLHKAVDEEQKALSVKREGELKESLLEELKKEILRLEEFREKHGHLAGAACELEQAEKNVEIKEGEVNGVKESCIRSEREKEAKQEEVNRARELAAQFTVLKESWEIGQEQYKKRIELDQCITRLAKAEQIMKQAADNAALEKKALLESRKTLEDLEIQWQQAQAAILAAHLTDGTPCPVCGSLDHPSPAAGEGTLPDGETMEKKRQEVRLHEQGYDSLSATAREKEGDVKTIQAAVEIYKTQLKSVLHQDPGELQQSLRDKERLLQKAEQAVKAVPLLEAEHAGIKKRERELKARLEEITSELSHLVELRGSARSRVTELKSEIPRDLHSMETLEKLCADKVREKEGIERFMRKGKEQADAAIRKVASIKGAAEQAKKALAAAQKAAQESLEGLLDRLHQAGFATPAEYREACISDHEIEVMEKEIREYTGKCRAAKQRVERAKTEAGDINLPDMEELQKAYGDAKENLEKKIREEQDLNNEMKKIKKLITDITLVDRESEELDRKSFTIGTLSKLANGDNAMKITFQRYVQATFLDDVLIAASRRLTVMSKGRFHLRRVTEQQDRRKSGGLNLEIDDAYTGRSRSVSTLSGGESFLAALSLALGLADVVQSYSGGMRLDTLFIDEGFGSLDAESLDCALSTLMDLRKGGRLVAIISHVSELRERIDTRLEIIPGTAGSSARFVVP